MCPPGYHHNSIVATHALGHMMYVHLASVRFEHSVCKLDFKVNQNLTLTKTYSVGFNHNTELP